MAISSSVVSVQNQGFIDVVIVLFSEVFPNDDQALSNTTALSFMNGFGLMLEPILLLFVNENIN